MKSKPGGRRANPGGRPLKPLNERTLWAGKIRIGISPEAALQLQQLMLRETPDVHTPEQMVEWLIRKESKMKTFNYEPKRELSATDLRQEVADYAGRAEIYAITIYDERGREAPEGAEALYLPDEGRLGIVWGGDASWADVRDVESGIEMWLNDGDAWLAAN